ncbi:3-dehydroquinate synthase [Tissierella praeacuta DSM 18095]|uniref:3-dehydroquinate synthase n=1 Tax=Tissierella praeacuta DSM 18095 TaxID=1123404 RepID=A0A1M4SVJ8_9FIRM|nr:3-dehydroquinate synthase [Tissierella praeacuta]SHE36224.1 3-dehydroquinate synthase [Tissierella praeacuta DSM 18095]SUP01810.1 3-dehydroquinate synthase [Tissierella praeacuta]
MGFKMVDNIWKELNQYIINDDFIFVTDRNVYNLYKDEIDEVLNGRENIYIIPSGEINKNLEELSSIYKILIKKNIDRNGKIFCLGGGVVGDLAGFAAATYKRGIEYIQIPTTLLSQVDSSIGGKTGIDFEGHKNIIGSFHFPLTTLIDTSFIHTLPEKEITCGLGEIIKYGLIEDYNFFKNIEKNIKKIYNRDMRILPTIIEKSVDIKFTIVDKDKLDLGLRQKLNLGHTIGHSIESFFKYEKYNHGEAVILGMMYESNIAYQKKLIDKEYYNEIIGVLNTLVEQPIFNSFEIKILIEYMKNDKKNRDGKISFILPTGRGTVDLFYDVEEKLIEEAILNDYKI